MSLELAKRPYFREMLKRGRFFPLIYEGKLHAFITYFIGNENEEKYIRDDPWSVIEDEPWGCICYIDQVWTSKDKKNPQRSFNAWKRFKEYIKKEYPSVRYFRWNRWNKKTGKLIEQKRSLFR
jgi:hypothetical protein